MISYQGSCHCGAVRFRFQSEPITDALQCNCSICIRKNAIMSSAYYQPQDFELLAGQDAMAVYHFGDHDVNHHFCKTCGIYPFHDSIYEPGKYRVNLGCVEGIEPRELNIRQYDGRTLL